MAPNSRRRKEPSMKTYLLSVVQPDGPTPSAPELEKIMTDVDALNDEMREAGAWVFSAGLHAPSTATVLRPERDDVLMTDGPFAEGKEHIGGLPIVRAEALDAPLRPSAGAGSGIRGHRACLSPRAWSRGGRPGPPLRPHRLRRGGGPGRA